MLIYECMRRNVPGTAYISGSAEMRMLWILLADEAEDLSREQIRNGFPGILSGK